MNRNAPIIFYLISTADAEIGPSSSSSQPGDREAQRSHKPAGPERKREGHLKKELHRQKVLLDESRRRLDEMKAGGGDGKQVRESLEGIQRKLSEQVAQWEKAKSQRSKQRGDESKHKEREAWKKEEKKERKHKEEKKENQWKPQKENSHKEAWRKHQDEWERKKSERRIDREERRKEKPWHSHSHHHHPQQQPRQHHHHQHHNDFWRDQDQKLHRNVRPQLGCASVEDCAAKEGLYPVELPEFEELLEGYLSKLEGSSNDSKDKIRKLTADFFEDGVFIHDRVRFGDFAEDVADILEDMVDVLEGGGQRDSDSLEEEMEEFEREALWKFAA